MATITDTVCTKCGRRLRNFSPDGLGPKCRRKVRRAGRSPELAAYKSYLVDKAIELLEQGGVVPLRDTRKNRVYLTASSDGTKTYKTARSACTCPAGLRAIYMCNHRIAVHILTVAA